MSVSITGIKEVDRMLTRVDRRCTKERQTIIKKAASKTLLPAVRAGASRSPGKAAALLAKYTTVRNGKNGAVLVGPRTGKGRAWWRHFFIVGTKAHEVGGPRGAGRRRQARGRVFLYNPSGFLATGPVRVPAIRPNPFVRTGTEFAQSAFVAELGKALFNGKES